MKNNLWNIAVIILLVYLMNCSAKQKTLVEQSSKEDACAMKVIGFVDSIPYHKAENTSVIIYTSGMTIDADGSPRAYHPDNIGLDDLNHAWTDGKLVGIATKNGEMIVQDENDPAPGFYVSQTSLEDRYYEIDDPRRYVNAEEIPYIVVPQSILDNTRVKLGDFAVVWNHHNDWHYFAIVADVGPEGKLGEGSIYLARRLGIDYNPRTGGVLNSISYFIFQGSGNGAPKTREEIEDKGKDLMHKAGGILQYQKCLLK